MEVEQGPLGGLAEDAIHPPGVEAQGAQAALEVGDVVAPEERGGVVEEAVAQAVAGLDQGGPGLGPAHAVAPQAPLVLEGPHRLLAGGAEDPQLVGRAVEPDRGEASLEVADRLAGVPRP